MKRILWHDVNGSSAPYPGVMHSLFFPLSADIADDDREDAEEARERREEAAKKAATAVKKR